MGKLTENRIAIEDAVKLENTHVQATFLFGVQTTVLTKLTYVKRTNINHLELHQRVLRMRKKYINCTNWANWRQPLDQARTAPTRSPRFPFIKLETAVWRARQLDDQVGERGGPSGAEVSVDEVLVAWGIKSVTSSALPQTIAALHQYGLLIDYGRANRRIALSELAQRILMAPDRAPEQEALRSAALKPRIFAEIWQELQRDRPNLIHFLTVAREIAGRAPFTRKGAAQVLRIFRESFQYAGLLEERHYQAIESSLVAGDQPLVEGPTTTIYSVPGSYLSERGVANEGWRDDWVTLDILIRYRGDPRRVYRLLRDHADWKLKFLDEINCARE